MPFSKIILIIGLTLVCKAHAVYTNLLSNKYDPEETVKQTEFCHLITDEAIALEVAEKTIELVDSTQCAEDPWSFSKHQSLKTNGSNIVYFIPAVYKPNNHQVHLEFSFWYF